MEQYLAANPGDIDVRSQLILYYYANGVREPRVSHIVWLVENHPETPAAAFASQGVLPRDSAFNSLADYQRVFGAWKRAVAARQNDSAVLGNAAQFMQAVGEWDTAETLLNTVVASQPRGLQWQDRLAKLYAAAILGATGDPKFPAVNASFANRAKSRLLTSDDGWLVFRAGATLRDIAKRPAAGEPLPAGVLNLNDHPLLVPAVDLGEQLIARAEQIPGWHEGVQRVGPAGPVIGGVPSSGPAGGVVGGIIGSVPANGPTGGVIGGVIGGVPATTTPQPAVELAPTPPVLKKVDPVYPPLALQARISGVVKLRAVIGTDGTMQHLEVVSGHPLLVPAAIQALKDWMFVPQPAEVRTLIEIPFNLPPGDYPMPGDRQGKSVQQNMPMKIRVGANVQSSKLIRKVDPIYPAQAKAEGIEGSVTLQVTIGEDGQVQSAEPIEGNPILAAAAQEAVKQWGYQPTLLNGRPVSVITTVVVPFPAN